jgi:hypothetical protein
VFLYSTPKVSIIWITVDGLSAPMSAAHFHNAATGTNGGVVRALTFTGNTTSGIWKATDSRPLTPALIKEIIAGNIYVNVHTPNNPGGEIRGQLSLSAGIGFIANINNSQEVPSTVSNGVGTGAFVLDAEGLHYWITINGLSTTLSAAHFHKAPAGQSGGVVRALTFTGNSASGVWTATDSRPLTPALIQDIIAGNIYVNVHTANNPSGEIRGQVTLGAGVRFVANITGAQENPAVTGNGQGTGVFVWNADGLHYWVTVTGLTGPINAAHFHNAATGTNGGVVRAIIFDGNSSSGVWKTSDTQALTPELLTAILAGNTYVNVHTSANPSGEVRGQVTMRPGVGFIANLSGNQTNPPIPGSGQGTGAFILDATGLNYWVTVAGLTGPITNAHFHNAPVGQNGGVAQATPFTGSGTTGTWVPTDILLEQLWAGNLYINVHTGENRGGEIRGQVVLPNPGTAGLELAFSRSIAGRSPNFAWSAPLGPGGKTKVNIVAEPNLLGRVVGANGYYTARLQNPATGETLNTWNSIPISGGQTINLQLPVRGRATQQGPGTPIAAAAKLTPNAVASIGITDIGPRIPVVSLRTIESTSDNVIVPLRLTQANDLTGGAWTLTYDPAMLTFQQAEIQGQKAHVLEAQSGQVTITLDGLISEKESILQLVFDRKETSPGHLQIEGFFFDSNHMPILALNERLTLDQTLPLDFALGQNHPNPFNPATQIRYALPQSGQIRLAIYNTLGQQVAQLFNGHQEAGIHVIRWNAENVASGIYYYRLEADGFSDTRKMMLLK